MLNFDSIFNRQDRYCLWDCRRRDERSLDTWRVAWQSSAWIDEEERQDDSNVMLGDLAILWPNWKWGNDPNISVRTVSLSASHGEITLMLLANCLHQEEISVP